MGSRHQRRPAIVISFNRSCKTQERCLDEDSVFVSGNGAAVKWTGSAQRQRKRGQFEASMF